MSGIAFAVAAVSFVVGGLGAHHIVIIALAAVLLGMAAQATLIVGQHTIYRLDAHARARLNSVYIAIFFAGGAAGSQLGSIAYRVGGWGLAGILGVSMPLLALAYWSTGHRDQNRRSDVFWSARLEPSGLADRTRGSEA